MLNKYTIGADPELFVFNKKIKRVVSAIDKIPGTKEKPYTEGLPDGFGLQTDNILAEFNIPPETNLKAFINNINYMKNVIRTRLQTIDEDLDILCVASAKAPVKELKDPQAKMFG